MDSLQSNIQFIEKVREEAERDREAREAIMKRLHAVENSSEAAEKYFGQRSRTYLMK